MNMYKIAEEFQSEANSKKNGFCKMWKASGIVITAKDFFENQNRIEKYLKQCLLMEGFDEETCTELSHWLQNKFYQSET